MRIEDVYDALLCLAIGGALITALGIDLAMIIEARKIYVAARRAHNATKGG